MKNRFSFVLVMLSVAGCKKSSSGGGNGTANGTVSRIIVYNPLGHILNVQSFTYSGGLLTNYSDRTTDSTSSEIDIENRMYTFTYSGPGTTPNAFTFFDSTYFGNNVTLGGAPPYDFVYDTKNRLVMDSSTTGTSTGAYYQYFGDSIALSTGFPGGPFVSSGALITNGGNLARAGYVRYTYSSYANPLHNSAIASTFGPFFYCGMIGVHLESSAMAVDFISNNLPSGIAATGGNPAPVFNWTKDANGRVVSGTVSDLYPYSPGMNGTIQITFIYQ